MLIVVARKEVLIGSSLMNEPYALTVTASVNRVGVRVVESPERTAVTIAVLPRIKT